LAEAKSQVKGPPSAKQTIKLKMGEIKQSGIKIKFGAKSSPSSTRTGTPIVEKGTPEVIGTKLNGRTPLAASTGATGTPALELSRSASVASANRTVLNGVKAESAAQSPAVETVEAVKPVPPKPTLPPQYLLPSVDGPPPGLVESKWRPKQQPESDYLLPELRMRNHPSLTDPKFAMRIPASKDTLHQSVTVTVPANHNFLRLTPNVPVGSTHRPYRLFVSVNGSRVSEVVNPHGMNHHQHPYQNGLYGHHQSTTGYGLEKERDKSRPVFDAQLVRGAVNKIEVEVLAGKAASMNPAPTSSNGGTPSGDEDKEREKEKEKEEKKKKPEVQWEKMTCYIHVLRN
jgi:hypothetical protein